MHTHNDRYNSVMRLSASADRDLLGRFFQLLPYFRGAHTIDEMMWRESMSRADVTDVLDKFRAVLHKVVS